MTRPALEVADILRAYGDRFLDQYGERISEAQGRVIRRLLQCRTAALGGHVDVCDQCGHRDIAYNSCHDRHCPKCQGTAQAQWLEARARDLLPVAYYHVVFTLPREIAAIALGNKRVLYNILFSAASQTLLQIAADPAHLGARIGFLTVLHTWGQKLDHHPHLHCVVPGGGLSLDGTSWIDCRPGFLLPVKVLSRVYRGKFLDALRKAYHDNRLRFGGSTAELVDPSNFEALLSKCYRREWVVFVKPPFGGPEVVLRYLARYTHRIAISNSRLVAIGDDQVTFSWKDYAHGNRRRQMTLSAVEFIRRFLMHVLPKGFVRIRHYGLLANRCRGDLLDSCRALIAEQLGDPIPSPDADEPILLDPFLVACLTPCPCCGDGYMRRTNIQVSHAELIAARGPPVTA